MKAHSMRPWRLAGLQRQREALQSPQSRGTRRLLARDPDRVGDEQVIRREMTPADDAKLVARVGEELSKVK